MVPKKKQSKRMSLKMKYKIKKKVSEHNKKQKKETKKNGKSKKMVVDTVPKMMPNRESIIENLKNRKPLLQLSSIVDHKEEVEQVEEEIETVKEKVVPQSGNRLIHQAIDEAEAVVQVLDARCPEAFRNKTVEAYISNSKKPFIQVITKIDLVDQSILLQWKSKLPGQVYMVKCNTQSQKAHLSRNAGPQSAKNVESLYLHLIKYRTVAIFGAPSVGKSSLINSLSRQRVATSGKNDGTTRGIMKVAVSKKLTLLDTPGVYPESNDKLLTLIQSKDVESLFEWFKLHNGLVQLSLAYSIPYVDTSDSFIEAICNKYKYLSKGKLDLYRAAVKIFTTFKECGFWQCEPTSAGYRLCPKLDTAMDVDNDEMDEWMEDDLGQ